MHVMCGVSSNWQSCEWTEADSHAWSILSRQTWKPSTSCRLCSFRRLIACTHWHAAVLSMPTLCKTCHSNMGWLCTYKRCTYKRLSSTKHNVTKHPVSVQPVDKLTCWAHVYAELGATSAQTLGEEETGVAAGLAAYGEGEVTMADGLGTVVTAEVVPGVAVGVAVTPVSARPGLVVATGLDDGETVAGELTDGEAEPEEVTDGEVEVPEGQRPQVAAQ